MSIFCENTKLLSLSNGCVGWMRGGLDSGHHSQLRVLSLFLAAGPPEENGVRPASAAATWNRGVPKPQGGTWQQLREREAVWPGRPDSPVLPRGTAAAPRQWRCGNGRMSLAGGGLTEGMSAATSNRFFRPRSRRAGVQGQGLSAASLWDVRILSWRPTSLTSQA